MVSRTTPPELPRVDVPTPNWPVVDRVRRRAATARSVLGRAATIAGAAAGAVGMLTDIVFWPALIGDVVLTLGGLAMLRALTPGGHQKAVASVMYLLPGAGLAVLLGIEQLTAGPHWVDALALTAWTAGTWMIRPAAAARDMLVPPPPPAPRRQEDSDVVVTGTVTTEDPVAAWWARHAAGVAPGTALENIRRSGEMLIADICSTVPGQPVPDISIRRLSALMDIPEDLISIGPVPGRGAGVQRITVRRPGAADPAEAWKQIADVAMPGARLVAVRVGRPAALDMEETR